MKEVWKPIPGAPGYMASDLGRVLSPNKILKPCRRPSGHTVVWVKGHGLKYVHQFVLAAFIGPRPPGMVSLHLNHMPSDNRLCNLRYGTVSENIRMDVAAGTRKYRCGEACIAARISDAAVYAIRSSSDNAKKLASQFGITPHHVRAIRRGSARSFEQNPSQLKEYPMAKAPKSPAEIKAAKAELKEALKVVNTEHGKFVSDHKAAEKALAAATKEADKAIAAARKLVDAAGKKLAKATAAADKGRAKINAKLAELSGESTPA